MKLTMFLTVRRFNIAASDHAIESFLRELTEQTDIIAIRSDDSMGQFIYYTLTTDMQAHSVSRIAHQILNNYETEEKRMRRYILSRCYIRDYTE